MANLLDFVHQNASICITILIYGLKVLGFAIFYNYSNASTGFVNKSSVIVHVICRPV